MVCYVLAMSATNTTIRRLRQNDAAPFRDIRLEGLRLDPEAFGSSFEFESPQPLTFFSGSLENSEVLGAFDGADLAAVAGLMIQNGAKNAHKAKLWGMYVRPTERRSGVGRRLVSAIIEVAAARAELIQLNVTRGNEAAHRLYLSLGFEDYGLEVNALKHNGVYYDEILMARSLRLPSR